MQSVSDVESLLEADAHRQALAESQGAAGGAGGKGAKKSGGGGPPDITAIKKALTHVPSKARVGGTKKSGGGARGADIKAVGGGGASGADIKAVGGSLSPSNQK